jgi:hypothetical protein
MNADKLIKIAKLLDDKNHFALADKVDKIAQTSTSGIWYHDNPNAPWYHPANWYQKMDAFTGRQQMYDFARDLRTEKKLNKLRNQKQYGTTNSNQPQQFGQPQQNQPQQPQQQSPLLVSSSPQQFVSNLLQFGKQNNLSDLAQTMDMYANQGGTYNGQPINQNQQAKNLYNQVKNNPGFLSQQQILLMLTGAGR